MPPMGVKLLFWLTGISYVKHKPFYHLKSNDYIDFWPASGLKLLFSPICDFSTLCYLMQPIHHQKK